MEDLSRDQLLEDLQARRQGAERSRRVFTKRTTFFSLCVLVLFAIVVALILRNGPAATRSATPAPQVEHLKRVADRLKVQGLPQQAIRYYERYLDAATLEDDERANISFIIAELAAKSGKFEDALAWLASAEQWGPAASVKGDIARLQRLCFERLGRPVDADYQLASATALDGGGASPRGKVVASIGADKITMGEIDDALQALPQAMRDIYAKPGHKLAFVQQYVHTRILQQKAKNLGYDRDPAVRKQIESLAAGVMVQAFVRKEIDEKIEVSDSDLKLYYRVHEAKYGEPAQVRLAHILVADAKAADDLIAKLKAGVDFAELAKKHSRDADTKDSGGELTEWLRQGGSVRALPGATKLDAAFAAKPGDVADAAIESKRGRHVVKVLQKKDARTKPLSEVREQVEAAYRAQKQQERLGQIVLEAQKQLNVQLFPEAFAVDAPAQPGPKKIEIKQP